MLYFCLVPYLNCSEASLWPFWRWRPRPPCSQPLCLLSFLKMMVAKSKRLEKKRVKQQLRCFKFCTYLFCDDWFVQSRLDDYAHHDGDDTMTVPPCCCGGTRLSGAPGTGGVSSVSIAIPSLGLWQRHPCDHSTASSTAFIHSNTPAAVPQSRT